MRREGRVALQTHVCVCLSVFLNYYLFSVYCLSMKREYFAGSDLCGACSPPHGEHLRDKALRTDSVHRSDNRNLPSAWITVSGGPQPVRSHKRLEDWAL